MKIWIAFVILWTVTFAVALSAPPGENDSDCNTGSTSILGGFLTESDCNIHCNGLGGSPCGCTLSSGRWCHRNATTRSWSTNIMCCISTATECEWDKTHECWNVAGRCGCIDIWSITEESIIELDDR